MKDLFEEISYYNLTSTNHQAQIQKERYFQKLFSAIQQISFYHIRVFYHRKSLKG